MPFVTIPCTVYPGMFSNERGVVVEIGGRVIALFAPEDAIIQGRLKVRIVRTVEGGVVVDLPGDSFQAGTRIVVPASFLEPKEKDQSVSVG